MELTYDELVHSNKRSLEVFGCYTTDCDVCGDRFAVRGSEIGEVIVYERHLLCKVKRFFGLG